MIKLIQNKCIVSWLIYFILVYKGYFWLCLEYVWIKKKTEEGYHVQLTNMLSGYSLFGIVQEVSSEMLHECSQDLARENPFTIYFTFFMWCSVTGNLYTLFLWCVCVTKKYKYVGS